MQPSTKTYIKFIDFKDFRLWDAKRYSAKEITSQFPMVSLGNYIQEQNKKYKLFLEPEKDFGILGVNNVDGVFDAYTQKGKEINQAYKKMQTGWIAYNPYRVNVGSTGIKKTEHKNEYISPAYVVFSCKENLLPEFLFLVFKTKAFSRVINDNTTGSVRQNLTFDILKSLQIPLPPLSEQEKIVSSYFEKINRAKELERENEAIRKNLERVLFEEVKEEPKQKTDKRLKFVEFASMKNWDVKFYTTKTTKFNTNIPLILFNTFLKKAIIKTIQIEDDKEYSILGVRSYGMGAYINRTIKGKFLKMKKYQQAKENHLFWCKVDTKNGAFGVVYKNLSHTVASTNMTFAEIDTSKVSVDFLQLLFSIKGIMQYLDSFVTGTTNRKYIKPSQFLNEIKIPLPPLSEQEKLIGNYYENIKEIESLKHQAETELEQTVFM